MNQSKLTAVNEKMTKQ